MVDARSLDEIRHDVHRRWRAIALSTAPIDKARARSAVEALYKTAIGRPPLYVLFFASPREAALACGFFSGAYPQQPLRLREGPRLTHVVHESVGRLRDRFFEPVIGRAAAWHDLVRDAVDASEIPERSLLLESIFQVLTRQLPPLASRLLITPGWEPSYGRKPSDAAQLFGLADWILAASYHDYYRAAFPCRRTFDGNALLIPAVTEVCKTCGWCAFHDDIAIVTDRPATLRLDAGERLHAHDGPALTYRDDFSIHALRGVSVPRRLVERPDCITIDDVENQPNVPARRALLERMGYPRYFALSRAEPIARDESGTLWRRQLPRIGHVQREWRFVEVINGTPEHGSYRHYYLQVPPTMRTAREAAAWTYGLGQWEYRPLIRT